MERIKSILCPVDFSDASDRAVQQAVDLAVWYEARLLIHHVINLQMSAAYAETMDLENLLRPFRKEAEQRLAALRQRAEEAGAEVVTETVAGIVEAEIEAAAERADADLVVLGTHGRRGVRRWVLGSVTERLLRGCRVPMLILPGAGGAGDLRRFRHILVAVDLAEPDRQGLDYAYTLAQQQQARVTLMHVIQAVVRDVNAAARTLYFDLLVGALREHMQQSLPAELPVWCETETVVKTGSAHERILDYAGEAEVDLIVLRTRTKPFMDRAVLGTTAERLIRSAACPVLAVPPPPAAGDAASSTGEVLE